MGRIRSNGWIQGLSISLVLCSSATIWCEKMATLVLLFSCMNSQFYFLLILTFSKMVCEFGAWQAPFWKLPQVPEGVPKLANSISDMECPGAHCSWTLAWWCLSNLLLLTLCQFSAVGWCSSASAQTLFTALFIRAILDASPPSSSKTINKFCVGFNHDLGTWYLKDPEVRII